MMKLYDAFLSHNSHDKPVVEKIAKKLKEEGLNPFLDKWHLIPGDPWQEALEKALDESKTCIVFLGPNGIGAWENEEMRVALDIRVKEKGFRVVPVLLPKAIFPERAKLPRFLSRLTWVDFREGIENPETFHLLISGIHGLPPNLITQTESTLILKSPYRGLESFKPEDEEWFFGRESETQQLIEIIKTSRFLAVTGASGSGKSSLVLAGLVPAIKKGVMSGSEDWPMLIFSPTEQPLQELAVNLANLASNTTATKLLADLETDERSLHLIVRQLIRRTGNISKVVIIIDQFEEIFLCKDKKNQEKFIDNILYASEITNGQIIIVITIRADFIVRCGEYSQLADRLSKAQFFVTPMVESQVLDAILQPAAKANIDFEPGLAKMICSEVISQPGGLPLMSHTLYELWKRRKGSVLTFSSYQEVGGIAGALTQTADRAYDHFNKDEQPIADRLLLELVQPSDNRDFIRKRVKLSDFLLREIYPAIVQSVIQHLANERLITIERDRDSDLIFVNIAHEALIRNWPLLSALIEKNRENLKTQYRLRVAAQEWNETSRDDGLLFRGVRLAQAIEWEKEFLSQIGVLENEFLRASEQAELVARSQKQQTELFIALAHEISTPLTGIMADSENLQYELPEGSDLRELASHNLHQVMRLHLLTSTIMGVFLGRTLSRDFRYHSILRPIKDALSLYENEARVKGISISGFMPADSLPAPEIEMSLYDLSLAFKNLIDNAIKYSFVDLPKGIQNHVKVLGYWHNDEHQHYSISITNYGVGITKEEIEKKLVFMPFYRGAFSSSVRRTGSGMGLAFARQVIEDIHHGVMSVSSKPLSENGYLNEFIVTLPVAHKK